MGNLVLHLILGAAALPRRGETASTPQGLASQRAP